MKHNNRKCELLSNSNRPCEILPEPDYKIKDGYLYRNGIKYSKIIEIQSKSGMTGTSIKIVSETLDEQMTIVTFIDETQYLKLSKANEKRLNKSLKEIKRTEQRAWIKAVLMIGIIAYIMYEGIQLLLTTIQ